tara:strand:+ start:3308 stop:3694 length:387 start_codon:yes stop_codon:yes gene_type:complete
MNASEGPGDLSISVQRWRNRFFIQLGLLACLLTVSAVSMWIAVSSDFEPLFTEEEVLEAGVEWGRIVFERFEEIKSHPEIHREAFLQIIREERHDFAGISDEDLPSFSEAVWNEYSRLKDERDSQIWK